MRLSIRWLRQYLNTDASIDELIDTITLSGLEVEEEIDLGMRSGLIVISRVLETQPHPDADKLTLCTVDIGEKQPLEIVCGAPNVRAGMIVPCAKVGATLPNGMVIKKARIRGQKSVGMLCSGHELGFNQDQSGIMELDETSPVGEPFDFLVELAVTPNRPDCLSVLGVGRDVGAMLGLKVFPPTPRFTEMLERIDTFVRLAIEARSECTRYACRMMRGLRIGESPLWLQRALESMGLRPINNVVDVTNYVLMELGHPLHAFDFDTLVGGEVHVRLAEPGEKLTIIDGSELELSPEDLVIADARRAIALAGVMGGADTEVGDKTVNVLLESAYFDPATIRKTARRHGLQTDSSYRFERGADRDSLLLPLNRATRLIQELAGGEIAKGLIDVNIASPEPAPIVLEIQRVNNLLGLTLSSTEIADYLVNLGFEIRRSDRDSLMVVHPSHRIDVTRDVDLIEEVARLYNYNRIPSTMPRIVPRQSTADPLDLLHERTQSAMVAQGLSEAMSYSFIAEEQAQRLGFEPAAQPHLTNPLTIDQVIMRPTVLCGLLNAVAENQKHDEPSIGLFEIGKVWSPDAKAGVPECEGSELGIVMGGPVPGNWAQPERDRDFYDLKGALECLIDNWGGGHWLVQPLKDSPIFHPGRSGNVQWLGQTIGQIGEIHPDLADAYDLRGRILAAKMDLKAVAELAAGRSTSYKQPPRYPGSWRDLALVVDRATPAGDLLTAVRKTGGALLEDVRLFDVYEGERVEADKKSLALRLRLRDPDKTLTEDEIVQAVDRIVKQLGKAFGATLRA